jgi:hypothetical protein
VAAPVERVALPDDQPALFQPVEQRNQPARIDRQGIGDRSLCLPNALREDRENAVVVQLEACLLHRGDRLCLEGEPEPREQEPATRDQFLRHPVNRADRMICGKSCHVE